MPDPAKEVRRGVDDASVAGVVEGPRADTPRGRAALWAWLANLVLWGEPRLVVQPGAATCAVQRHRMFLGDATGGVRRSGGRYFQWRRQIELLSVSFTPIEPVATTRAV
jgi:hypothetical protein